MAKSDLKQLFFENLNTNLCKKSITSCSRWSEKYRIMGKPIAGPWRFKYHPWLKEMHDTDHEFCVGSKSAQAGFTETGLNRTFYTIDNLRLSVMYVLPSKTPDATDFSSARFDTALELSPHLQNLFSDVKNIGHKRAGGVNLYIRGSRSRAGLKSVPASLLVLDEVDEMVQDNISLVLERQSGQFQKQTWMFSTPSIPDYGIDRYYKNSSAEEFFFICPHCGKRIKLELENLVITADDPNDSKIQDSHIICTLCKKKLNHETKHEYLASGIWVPQYKDKEHRGFHVNQLYSSTVKPYEIAKYVILSETDPAVEQELYNSKLGQARITESAKLEDSEIDPCEQNYLNGQTIPSNNSIVTLGVDVGKRWLHTTLIEWRLKKNAYTVDINDCAQAKVINIKKVETFEEVGRLIKKYQPHMTLIDANPETRKASELASEFWGYVKLCYYGRGIVKREISKGNDQDDYFITVDRTSWIDVVHQRYRDQSIALPKDTPLEFKAHLKAVVKKYEKDDVGNPISRYVTVDADHYLHSNVYAEIALKLAAALSSNQSIA